MLRTIQLKPDVKYECDGVMRIVLVALSVYEQLGKPLVITSLTDGKHMKTSKHYTGEAVDLRIFHLTEVEKVAATERIAVALGKDYDVVLEGDHIHAEYDPK